MEEGDKRSMLLGVIPRLSGGRGGQEEYVTGSDTKVGRVGEGDKRSMLLGVIPRLVK